MFTISGGVGRGGSATISSIKQASPFVSTILDNKYSSYCQCRVGGVYIPPYRGTVGSLIQGESCLEEAECHRSTMGHGWCQGSLTQTRRDMPRCWLSWLSWLSVLSWFSQCLWYLRDLVLVCQSVSPSVTIISSWDACAMHILKLIAFGFNILMLLSALVMRFSVSRMGSFSLVCLALQKLNQPRK